MFPKYVFDTWNKISPDSGSWYKCLYCGRSHANCLHHNFGRGGKSPDKRRSHASILNSVPLNNNDCHINNHTEVTRNLELLEKVFRIIERAVRTQEYQYRIEDYNFYSEYEDIYKKLNCNL